MNMDLFFVQWTEAPFFDDNIDLFMFSASSERSSKFPASPPSQSEEERTSAQSDDAGASSSDSESLMSIDSPDYLEIAYQIQGGIENVLNEIIGRLGYHNLPEDAPYVLGSWLHAESTHLVFLWEIYDWSFEGVMAEAQFQFCRAWSVLTEDEGPKKSY